MKISILTLFPQMISPFFEESIVKRAIEKKLVEIELVNLRDFAIDDYGTVDDRPYGGGAGMVIRVDVIQKALNTITNYELRIKDKNTKSVIHNQKIKKILTSPKGKLFTQQKAQEYAKLNHLIILSGHYEGIDERVHDLVDEEISLGDFILTGGEIAAATITDSVVRLIPKVLKKDEATQFESFFEVPIERLIEVVGEDAFLRLLKTKGIKKVKLLEYPHYTRPEEFEGKKTPHVLLSGNHKEIEQWRLREAYKITLKKRPDFFSV